MSCNIHPTAIVSKGAELGVEVEVGAYSIIGSNVKIGDRTRIAPHVVIEGYTTLGAENELFQFASIGSAPQDLKYRGEHSTLVIGDRNKIREYVTLQPGTGTGTMTTIIGSGNLFMANCHVGHDCRVGNNNVFANSTGLAGHVSISNNVILGGLVGVHQFCRIGDYAILSAGSMVGLDIPPYCIGQGDRCFLRGVNILALKRAGFTTDEISRIKKVYRLLFASPGRLSTKIEKLPQDLLVCPRIKLLLDFVAGSKRGVESASRVVETESGE